MLFAVIFLIAFILLAGFALWLSKNVEHGEARFDTTGKAEKADAKEATPARSARSSQAIPPARQAPGARFPSQDRNSPLSKNKSKR